MYENNNYTIRTIANESTTRIGITHRDYNNMKVIQLNNIRV